MVEMYGAIPSTNTGADQGRSGAHIRRGRTRTNLSLGLFGNQQGIQWPHKFWWFISFKIFSFWNLSREQTTCFDNKSHYPRSCILHWKGVSEWRLCFSLSLPPGARHQTKLNLIKFDLWKAVVWERDQNGDHPRQQQRRLPTSWRRRVSPHERGRRGGGEGGREEGASRPPSSSAATRPGWSSSVTRQKANPMNPSIDWGDLAETSWFFPVLNFSDTKFFRY